MVPVETGILGRMTFQDAPVRKPLGAVSGITRKGNLVMFDCKGSFTVPSNAPEVEEIRRLVARAKDRITLEEKKGVYVMPIWVQTDPKADATVFGRQGM